jgi:ribosomal protein S27AE
MIDLRTYGPDQVATALAMARAYLESTGARPSELTSVLARLQFRDPQGRYWAADPLSQRWYQWQGGAWQLAAAPSGTLEGLAALDAPGKGTDELPPEGAEIETPPTAAEAASELTERLITAYQAGRLSSERADELLGRIALIDRQGRIWRRGVHSGGWYTFENGGWASQPEPPPDEALLTRSDLVAWANSESPDDGMDDQLAEAVGSALWSGADTLPEPVTAPWDTPDAPPPLWPACPQCEREAILGGRFCPWCGQPAPQDEKPRCPRCGSLTKATDRFCGKCGAPLS